MLSVFAITAALGAARFSPGLVAFTMFLTGETETKGLPC